MSAKILVLNDDPDLVHALGAVLEDAGYEVHVRQTRTLDDVIATKPDLVHIDCPPGATKELLNFVQRLRLDKESVSID